MYPFIGPETSKFCRTPRIADVWPLLTFFSEAGLVLYGALRCIVYHKSKYISAAMTTRGHITTSLRWLQITELLRLLHIMYPSWG